MFFLRLLRCLAINTYQQPLLNSQGPRVHLPLHSRVMALAQSENASSFVEEFLVFLHRPRSLDCLSIVHVFCWKSSELRIFED